MIKQCKLEQKVRFKSQYIVFFSPFKKFQNTKKSDIQRSKFLKSTIHIALFVQKFISKILFYLFAFKYLFNITKSTLKNTRRLRF
jgi:hypothetical protein